MTTTGIALSPLNALVVALSSILPDLDNGATTIGRLLPFVSAPLERRFGHRTLTHSAPLAIGLAIMLIPVLYLSPDIYTCFIVGYLSHPFLDSMTINGVQLFFPFSTAKCVFPLEVNNPHGYRMETGSRADRMLGGLFLAASIPVFLIANQGYERFVRSAQKNIESAVRDYNELSRENFVHAEISGYDMLTKNHIRGEYEVIGSLNEQTLVFQGADGRATPSGGSIMPTTSPRA